MILNVVSSGYEDYYSLIIYTNSGAEVVVENKYATYTKIADRMGSVAFCVTEGSWNIVSTKDGQSKIASINVVKDNILDMMFHYYPEFVYDGEYEIINEGEMNWHIKFKTSGTLSFANLNSVVDGIEVFLCGGGGRGGNGGTFGGGGGGGGGYTTTGDFTPTANSSYAITIGGSGEATTGFGFTANPGTSGNGGSNGESYSASGGAGTGQGGGGGMGSGGIPAVGYNGSDGVFAFGIEGTTRYGGGGGGGGGGGNGSTTGGNGGAGGASGGGTGGTGGAYTQGATAGIANTGGGGGGGGGYNRDGAAGGSGIVIIRNKRS